MIKNKAHNIVFKATLRVCLNTFSLCLMKKKELGIKSYSLSPFMPVPMQLALSLHIHEIHIQIISVQKTY